MAHKSLPVETIPWRFTEKGEIAPSGQTLVPVLVNGDRWIAGSWTIANYLEDTFPDSLSLFGGASGRDLTRYYSSLADSLGAAIFQFVAFDIWQHVADKDREYFRASREKRVGKTLEALVADRHARLPAFRASLAPLRLTLQAQSGLSMPTMPSSVRSNGRDASVRFPCWRRTIRSGCGGIVYSIALTAWHAQRQPTTPSSMSPLWANIDEVSDVPERTTR